jgi:hypothetical protein
VARRSGLVEVWRGEVHGKADEAVGVVVGKEWRSRSGFGAVCFGVAWRGEAVTFRFGAARFGTARRSGYGWRARQAVGWLVRQGKARRSRCGWVWQRRARRSGHVMVGRGSARRGKAVKLKKWWAVVAHHVTKHNTRRTINV